MATHQELAETVVPADTVAEPAPPHRPYDRSSLDGDYMVMIDGQTGADFERDAPESQFCEYIDGVIYMPSPVSYRHQDQVNFLTFLLLGYLGERPLGSVMTGPGVLRLDPEKKLEPDIFIMPAPATAPETAGPQPLASLVVEVFSPSTRAYDLHTKLPIFRAFRIPEIWLIDDFNHLVIVESRGAEGASYEHSERTTGLLHSTALPGFWIDIAWLWEAELPNPRLCLEQILGAPPG